MSHFIFILYTAAIVCLIPAIIQIKCVHTVWNFKSNDPTKMAQCAVEKQDIRTRRKSDIRESLENVWTRCNIVWACVSSG
jgi:hypothetical protein